jgi:hypothetical protein
MSGTPARASLPARLSGSLLTLVLVLGSASLIALSPDVALPLIVLLLPGLVALMMDSSPGAAVARAMLLFQSATGIGPVCAGWYRCSGINLCLHHICEPMTVIRVWLAAAAAWSLSAVLPIGLKLLEDHRLKAYRTKLVSRRAVLVEEWGLQGGETP